MTWNDVNGLDKREDEPEEEREKREEEEKNDFESTHDPYPEGYIDKDDEDEDDIGGKHIS